MQELTTTATLVDYETFEGGSPITAVLARSELEAALNADESAQLWFELGLEEDGQTKLLTMDLDSVALEQMLRTAGGDDILVAFDADAVVGLWDGPDVEGHGLRGALAIAVAVAAVAAPTSLAAAPLTANPSATVQRAGVAATVQTAGVAATVQTAGVAASVHTAKVHVAGVSATTKINKSLVVLASGVKLHGGLVR